MWIWFWRLHPLNERQLGFGEPPLCPLRLLRWTFVSSQVVTTFPPSPRCNSSCRDSSRNDTQHALHGTKHDKTATMTSTHPNSLPHSFKLTHHATSPPVGLHGVSGRFGAVGGDHDGAAADQEAPEHWKHPEAAAVDVENPMCQREGERELMTTCTKRIPYSFGNKLATKPLLYNDKLWFMILIMHI